MTKRDKLLYLIKQRIEAKDKTIGVFINSKKEDVECENEFLIFDLTNYDNLAKNIKNEFDEELNLTHHQLYEEELYIDSYFLEKDVHDLKNKNNETVMRMVTKPLTNKIEDIKVV